MRFLTQSTRLPLRRPVRPRPVKKTSAIIGAVAAYSVSETGLLLSLDLPGGPQPKPFPTTYQLIVIWGQLLLIPGTAALMSRILYGPHQWCRRTLTILLYGILSIPVSILVFAILILPLALAADVSSVLFYITLPIVVLAAAWALRFLIRKSGGWAVRAETERWWSEREAGASRHEKAWRTRSIGVASCIPVLIVLPVFLFLPETWGILSHLAHGRSAVLAGYRVRVPATWVVLNHWTDPSGSSSVSGIAGKGIGRGRNPFRYDSVAAWFVGTDPFVRAQYEDDPWMPKKDQILSQGSFQIGAESVVCADYLSPYLYWRSAGATTAHVRCSGSGRLRASYDGPRTQVADFYRVIGAITPAR